MEDSGSGQCAGGVKREDLCTYHEVWKIAAVVSVHEGCKGGLCVLTMRCEKGGSVYLP